MTDLGAVCKHFVCVFTYMYVHMWGPEVDFRLSSTVALHLNFEIGSKLEVTNPARLNGQQAPGIIMSLLLFSIYRVQDSFQEMVPPTVGTGSSPCLGEHNQDNSPQTCPKDHLPGEISLSLLTVPST